MSQKDQHTFKFQAFISISPFIHKRGIPCTHYLIFTQTELLKYCFHTIPSSTNHLFSWQPFFPLSLVKWLCLESVPLLHNIVKKTDISLFFYEFGKTTRPTPENLLGNILFYPKNIKRISNNCISIFGSEQKVNFDFFFSLIRGTSVPKCVIYHARTLEHWIPIIHSECSPLKHMVLFFQIFSVSDTKYNRQKKRQHFSTKLSNK